MFPKPVHRKPPADRFPAGLAGLVKDRDMVVTGRHCIAPFVDGTAGPCSGRSTIQHVKTEVGMSIPRIHREEMLVTLCAGHHLDTRTGGANWATAHMDEQRHYLARLYPNFWREFIERTKDAPGT